MSNTYYTQTLSSDGTGLANISNNQPSAPYIVYNCRNTVNINFLFREVLFCDPEAIGVSPDDSTKGSSKVHIIPTYDSDTTAFNATVAQRMSDVSSTYGHYYAMRFLGAVMKSELTLGTAEQSAMDAYIKHYGGYKTGLTTGSSVNATDSTATFDFGEFFQVALSAIRNKDTDAATTYEKGIIDRENINNAAVSDDIKSRSLSNTSASKLLQSILTSSKKTASYSDGNIIGGVSEVNWMKQLLYSIITNTNTGGGSSETEGNERYRPIKRDNITNNNQEQFLQLRLKDGDSIVLVFQFDVSDGTNSFDNTRPDDPTKPITIGFKITHSDTAPEYDDTDTGNSTYLPIGWIENAIAGSSGAGGSGVPPVVTLFLKTMGSYYYGGISDDFAVSDISSVYTNEMTDSREMFVLKTDSTLAYMGGYKDSTNTTYLDKYIQLESAYARNGADFGKNISIYDKYLVVGAPNHTYNSITERGSVHLYKYDGTTWNFDSLVDMGSSNYQHVGSSVAINRKHMLYGISYADPAAGLANAGRINIYTYDDINGWVSNSYILPSDIGNGDTFGESISLQNNRLLCGSTRWDSTTSTDVGKGYIFDYDDINGWVETAGLEASDSAAGDLLSSSTALDGNVAVLGAYQKQDATSAGSGAAYVYELSGTWSQSAKLTLPLAETSAEFGVSVDVLGNTIVVGAHLKDSTATDAGAVYVYMKTGGTWTYQQELTPSTAVVGDQFGASVKLYNDRLYVGAPNDDTEGTDVGAVYEFILSGGMYVENKKIYSGQPGTALSFGSSLSIHDDNLVVGSINDPQLAYTGTGGVYVIKLFSAKNTGAINMDISPDETGEKIRDPGVNSSIIDMDSNYNSVSVVKSNGTVVSWGDSYYGGDNSSVNTSNTTKVVATKKAYAALKSDGTAVTWGHSAYGGDSSGVTLVDISDIVSNERAFAALKTDGTVITWGDSYYGGDSSGVTLSGVSSIHSNKMAFAALKSDGTVVVWGDYENGGYASDAVNKSLNNVVSISGTHYTFAAIKRDGSMVSWGNTAYGGDYSSVKTSVSGYVQETIVRNTVIDGSSFGSAVAIDGDWCIVGAETDDPNTSSSPTDPGVAYVYHYDGSNWVYHSRLLPNFDGNYNRFGSSVAIEGTVILVGEVNGGNSAGINDMGCVHVYEYDGSAWNWVIRLVASDKDVSSHYGASVSIHNGRIIVGAIDADPGGLTNAGSAYIVEKIGGTWTEIYKIVSASAAAGDNFGVSVSIYNDTVAIGSNFYDSASNTDNGRISVYDISGTPQLDQEIVASNVQNGSEFGISCSMYNTTLVVGSRYYDDGSKTDCGAVYVFELSGGTWSQTQLLIPSNLQAGDNFGSCVFVNDKYIIVGAPASTYSNYSDYGVVYVYTKVGGSWVEYSMIETDINGYTAATNTPNFGCSVHVTGDIISIGSRSSVVSNKVNAGCVTIIDLTDTTNKVTNVKSSMKNLLALRTYGDVLLWGDTDADYGGDNSAVSSSLTSISTIYGYNYGFSALDSNGKFISWGKSDYIPMYYANAEHGYANTSMDSGITSVYFTTDVMLGLKASGIVRIGNMFGTIGSYTSGTDNLTTVVSNKSSNIVLKTDKNIYGWGSRLGLAYYDLISSNISANVKSILASPKRNLYSLVVDNGGTDIVYSFGVDIDGAHTETLTTTVTSITQTERAVAILGADGTVVTFGDSAYGGNSSSVVLTDVSSIEASDRAFAALKSDGTVVTWGDSAYGGDSSAVTLTSVSSLKSTTRAFAALKSDGSVVTWGDSSYGGDSSAVSGSLVNMTELFSTDSAFAAMDLLGSVVTWGNSTNGGDSSSVNFTGGASTIYNNNTSFAALMNDSSVVTWGDSTSGGDSSAVSGSLTSVSSISSTSRAFAALRSDGSVITWGYSSYGGDSSGVSGSLVGITNIYGNHSTFVAVNGSNNIVTWGEFTYRDSSLDSTTVSASKIYDNKYSFSFLVQ